MRTVNIHDATTQLSRLVDKAATGEAFVISKNGKPMVKVMPLTGTENATLKRLGFLAGQISVPEDFDRVLGDETQRLFGGKA